ncbi:hypothetical protein MtrunA17_Chr6g0468851 [Medicago truncatula]|uniref:Uncharacterized protein n=1 Tax=Medicago truncatula TaxID=3880 RepID=A0A396HJL4_MEDTR|nr:hypothetical protein MtrunA17_Chr6g0468851 [Medicago truncatula]
MVPIFTSTPNLDFTIKAYIFLSLPSSIRTSILSSPLLVPPNNIILHKAISAFLTKSLPPSSTLTPSFSVTTPSTSFLSTTTTHTSSWDSLQIIIFSPLFPILFPSFSLIYNPF